MIQTSTLSTALSFIIVLLYVCTQQYYVQAFAPATPAVTTTIAARSSETTQLSAWSISAPAAATQQRRSFLSPITKNNDNNGWYEDYGQAAVNRHVRYQDDNELVDDYIWDSGNINRKGGGVGYGFARIESYETYLAYDDSSSTEAAVMIRRKPSLFRRGLRMVWNKLQPKKKTDSRGLFEERL